MMRHFDVDPMSSARTSYGRSVHDLEFGDGLTLVVLVWRRARRLTTDDRELHVFDFDSNQQEIYLPNNHILEMIPKPNLDIGGARSTDHSLGFVILKLNV